MNLGQVIHGRGLWLESLFRPLVIGVMFACIAVSLVDLVHLVFPAWNGAFLILGCVLAALEAGYSLQLIRAMALRGSDLLRFRIVEIAMFLLLLKIGSYLGDSWADVLRDIQSWPSSPLSIIDLEFVAASILTIISWNVSTQTARDFERLNDPTPHHFEHISPMESLASRFFWGGGMLLITTGLTRIGIAQLLNLRRPSVPGLVLNVLVYFLLGLVMLGQVRLTSLRRRWRAQEIRVADDLASRWVRYSLAFIGLTACLAFLLPTSYTLGLLDVIGWLLGVVLGIITFIAALLFWLVTLPIAWLLSLVGEGLVAPFPRQPLSQPAPGDLAPGPAPDWFQILRSLVFWALALGMIFYVVRSYVRDHPGLGQILSGLWPVRVLRSLWVALQGWWGKWKQAVREHMPHAFLHWPGRSATSPERPWRFFRLGALPPRSQIIYYYLSILGRAAQRGFARRRNQTPYEYEATLEANLPWAQEDMETLTQAFVEARYSPHAVEANQARRIRNHWQRVKAALRAIKGKIARE